MRFPTVLSLLLFCQEPHKRTKRKEKNEKMSSVFKGAIRTLLNVYDGGFRKNWKSLTISAKKLHNRWES